MVKENKEMRCFNCEECELSYIGKKKACEEWCKKNKSCNIEIIKHSLKIKGGNTG